MARTPSPRSESTLAAATALSSSSNNQCAFAVKVFATHFAAPWQERGLHFKEVAAGLSDHLAPQGLEFATWWSAGQSRRRQRVGHDPAKGSSSNS
jgi:hypothetical protein